MTDDRTTDTRTVRGSIRFKPGQAKAEFARLAALETDDCVLWPGARCRPGESGRLGGRSVAVLVCEMRYGPRPFPGAVCAHAPIICHNALCMNYRHLRWATQQENIADQVLDGTAPIGERHPAAKLTEADVREIRSTYRQGSRPSYNDLAKKYGVTLATIRDVIRRKNWGHVQ